MKAACTGRQDGRGRSLLSKDRQGVAKEPEPTVFELDSPYQVGNGRARALISMETSRTNHEEPAATLPAWS